MRSVALRPIRVRIAHPYPLVASGLVAVLGGVPDIVLLRDDTDGACADVVVADCHDGIALAAMARASAGRSATVTRVVVLSALCREQHVRSALEAGVSGYLQQHCDAAQLIGCVRQVAAGSRYLDPALAMRLSDTVGQEPLTQREREVLQVLSRGGCNKAIAIELGISVGTVKAHVKAIMAKLQAVSRTQAAGIALRCGLLDVAAPVRAPRAAPAPRPWVHGRAEALAA